MTRAPVTERDALVQADLARHLKRGEPLRILGNSLVAIALAFLMRDAAPLPWTLAWLTLMLGNAAYNARAAWRVRSRPTRTAAATRRLQVVTRMEATNGLLWMAAELLWLPGSNYEHRGLAMVVLSGLGAGVMHSLSAHLPALYAYALPVVLGFFLAGWLSNGAYWLVAVVMLLVWLAVNLNFARHMNRTLRESLHNHHRAQALAVDLQAQRDRAVELGQARSRFLAAASHDLRQPVHALSLFVGALQLDPGREQARALMGHVDSALAALSSLFNALLDISKLDAGLVQPDWQAMPLRRLLQRLAHDQAALAGDKGLQFELQAGGADEVWVRSDPVLLERVLRNLLANALRYTDHGRVRLQLRVRHGRAEILVADTGRGIPRAQRREVFQEFVQLAGPGGGRERGMGLGLSIVARLVGLLALQLRLRSRPGRGTVIGLLLPLLPAPEAAPAPVATRTAGDTRTGLQPGDVVLVIDDSEGVRLAMQGLLGGWGCEVFTAPDVDTLMPQLMALRTAPRLLLCDYRLQGGAGDPDGLDTIARLRDAFNDDLAAILITGDTAPDRLQQATGSGLPLLHKPVSPALLRQAIDQALA